MYTTSNAGYVKAFKAAKRYLSDYVGQGNFKRNFICYALEAAACAGKIDYGDYLAARALIRERLGAVMPTTLEGWLERHYPELNAEIQVDDSNRSHKMQATRHAWLDSLIKEFSK